MFSLHKVSGLLYISFVVALCNLETLEVYTKRCKKKKRLHETMSVRPPSAAKKLESLLFKHSDDFLESGSLNFFCN